MRIGDLLSLVFCNEGQEAQRSDADLHAAIHAAPWVTVHGVVSGAA